MTISNDAQTTPALSTPDGYRIQKTLTRSVAFEGVGLHTGVSCRVELHPAEPNHGIIFTRADIARPNQIFAHYDSVVATDLATSLGYVDDPQVRVSTVEHLMAALYAMGITNVLVEVTGPEIPILDGSASVFIESFRDVGMVFQPFSQPTLRVLKPIKVYQKGAICELLPRNRLRLTTSIDFPHPAIGLQTYALELTPNAFSEQIGRARTFGFLKDVERLKRHNLAQGASLENVLAFSDEAILNPGGARFSDECVRHKLLDALGDIALCGSWIEGELVSFRGGHFIHLELLKALKAQADHWELLPAESISVFSYDKKTRHTEPHAEFNANKNLIL